MKHMKDPTDWFFAIINSTRSGIIAVDEQGAITLVNHAAEEILGIAGKDAIGKHITEVSPKSMMPRVLETGEPLLGQKIEVGNTVTLTNYSPIILNGEVTGAVAVFQDISILERTSMELSVVRSLFKEMEAVINSSYDGIFITDGQGVVLKANKAYERISGISTEEIVGKNMRELVEDNYYDQSVTLLVMKERESRTLNQIVKGNRRVLVTGNPVFDDQGNLVRIVTNVRDISELANLQDQLAKTQAQTLKYEEELSHLRSLQIKDKEIIYCSTAMARTVELSIKVADVNSNVLILGESGTGKELVARLIHRHGKGISNPFIKINCSAIPEQLLESELFGYEAGAFTGANKKGKPGYFELAQHGTLFLDEVAELPLSLQAKMLRAIQEKEIVRIGGGHPITVDVRIIAATHRDIGDMLKTGQFREDLYYRLMVVPIHLTPLRERKEDMPLLIKYFIDKFNSQFGYQKKITNAAMDKLMTYSWPGNVRELENLIERMMVTAWGDELTTDQIPAPIGQRSYVPQRGTMLKTAVEQTESYLLSETFKEHGSWPKVAEVLGVDRSTIFRKAARYNLLDKNRQ